MSIPINLFLVLQIWKLNFPTLSKCSFFTSCNATVTYSIIYLYISFSESRFSTPWPQSSIFSSEMYLFQSYIIYLLPLLDLFLLPPGFSFLSLLHFLFFSLAEEKWRQLYFSLFPWHQPWVLSYFFTRFRYFLSFLYPLPSIQKHMQHQKKSRQLHQWLPTL